MSAPAVNPPPIANEETKVVFHTILSINTVFYYVNLVKGDKNFVKLKPRKLNFRD
jgi:hypothetical protein